MAEVAPLPLAEQSTCDACGFADGLPWACKGCGRAGLRCDTCEGQPCARCRAERPYTWKKIHGTEYLRKGEQIIVAGQGATLAHLANELHQLREELRTLPARLVAALDERRREQLTSAVSAVIEQAGQRPRRPD